MTDNDYDDQSPRVSGRNIAWVGETGGEDGEIFLAVHAPEPTTALLLIFAGGWLTRRRRARRIRRSYADTHYRHG
ncbi:MAG: PEP-CTERM sorting domain-containing protein [Phycisphaerae bacterium]|nr:PEP-CTERM sorting domain-containing protein [Phycisphaerae bacterium]